MRDKIILFISVLITTIFLILLYKPGPIIDNSNEAKAKIAAFYKRVEKELNNIGTK